MQLDFLSNRQEILGVLKYVRFKKIVHDDLHAFEHPGS